MIERIDVSFLLNIENNVVVSIVDSGFSFIPAHAKLFNTSNTSKIEHGNRILSIFSALDEEYPIRGLKLNLSCYNPTTGYDGLRRAIKVLPHSDILSLSMLWKDNDKGLMSLLLEKADVVLAPFATSSELMYPACYGFIKTCSNHNNTEADYSICPNRHWVGNSYAVPAMARLLAYGKGTECLTGSGRGMPVHELFKKCSLPEQRKSASNSGAHSSGKKKCPHCHRYIRNPITHGFTDVDMEACPYCGLSLK